MRRRRGRGACRPRTRARQGLDRSAIRSSERHLRALATVEDRDCLVPGRREERERTVEVAADEPRDMWARRHRDGNVSLAASAQQLHRRVELADRPTQPRGRHLDRDATFGDRVGDRCVVEPVDPVAEDLDEVRVGEHVEDAAACGVRENREVALPRRLDTKGIDQPRLAVDRVPVDEVDGAEQEIPRVRVENRARVVSAPRLVIDLEPELHRQPLFLRGDDCTDVRTEILPAEVDLVRHMPQRACLLEVVRVLAEADLVDAGRARRRDERLQGAGPVCQLLRLVAKVHVVVDDHSNAATRTRSSGSVTLSSFGQPATIATRPPRASTAAEQSVHGTDPGRWPASARRSTSATKTCGVCTVRRTERSRVSTTTSFSTRFTVSATGRPGTAPSQPALNASRPRASTSTATSGRAASWTAITAASAGTSSTAARTESVRVAPPATQALTLPHPSSSASRIAGSSQPGGAATTIASIHAEASSRSRLSASNGRSPRRTNAFGLSAPSRSPLPAAARTAQTLTLRRLQPSSSPPASSPSPSRQSPSSRAPSPVQASPSRPSSSRSSRLLSSSPPARRRSSPPSWRSRSRRPRLRARRRATLPSRPRRGPSRTSTRSRGASSP